MNTEFHLNPIIQYLAVAVWAISGTIVGQDRGFDIVGVFAIALITSTGGGILRDGLFLQDTPWVISDPVALPLIVTAVLIAMLLTPFMRRIRPHLDQAVAYLDAAGVPAFAIVGLSMALAQGIPLSGAIFIGLISGVGGGLIRDLLVSEIPALFRPGQYFTLIALLCLLIYLALVYSGVLSANGSATAAIGIAFILRALVIRFNWRTLPADAMTAQITHSIGRFTPLRYRPNKATGSPPETKIDN
ncbi:MAG: TRIC cation channel family protein [Anaerolineales bacterium]|nr:TRIC cation channel family protein [Anaerolineales bacterium]